MPRRIMLYHDAGCSHEAECDVMTLKVMSRRRMLYHDQDFMLRSRMLSRHMMLCHDAGKWLPFVTDRGDANLETSRIKYQ